MSCLDTYYDFSAETVETLQSIIKQHQDDAEYKGRFYNTIIREEIFELLSQWCTILFYPLPEEENDGFHISAPVNGENKHFVYINTGKKKEKQIFAAAHELGHIWIPKVDELNVPTEHAYIEDALMNRFAAELLIPGKPFRALAIQKMNDYIFDENSISKEDMFRVIAFLMNTFYVPFESVVFRFYETDLIDYPTCERIIRDGEESEGTQLLENAFKEAGYTNLTLNPDGKKAMPGFPELLCKAEDNGVFSEIKANNIRKKFGWERISNSKETLDIIKENGQ